MKIMQDIFYKFELFSKQIYKIVKTCVKWLENRSCQQTMTHTITDLDLCDNHPLELFDSWFNEAKLTEIAYHNAMTLSTVDTDGLPDARTVLLKDRDKDEFIFYTNSQSAKGKQLAFNPKACLLFYYKSLGRQIKIRGNITELNDEDTDNYFNTRPMISQLGAIASDQSQVLQSRKVLEDKLEHLKLIYKDKPIPRPKHWKGYRLKANSIEFWTEGQFRLHNRWVFVKLDDANACDQWQKNRLYP